MGSLYAPIPYEALQTVSALAGRRLQGASLAAAVNGSLAGTMLQTLRDAATEFGDHEMSAVLAGVNQALLIGDTASRLTGKVVAAGQNASATVTECATTEAAAIQASVQATFGTVVAAVNGAASRVAAELSGAVAQVQGSVRGALLGVQSAAGGAVSAVTAQLQGTVQAVRGAVVTVVSRLQAVVAEAAAMIKDTIKSAVASITAAVSSVATHVGDAAKVSRSPRPRSQRRIPQIALSRLACAAAGSGERRGRRDQEHCQ